jgi:hypothetical protein
MLSVRGSCCGFLIIQIEKNVAALDAYGDHLQADILRICATSRADIEFPMVPGTTENRSCQAALAQPAFLVRTSISIRIDVVINVDQQNAVLTDVQSQHFAAPKVVQ